MSVAEMKLAAISQITKLNSESALVEVLELLESKQKDSNVKETILGHARDIMKERSSVLEKLAQ